MLARCDHFLYSCRFPFSWSNWEPNCQATHTSLFLPTLLPRAHTQTHTHTHSNPQILTGFGPSYFLSVATFLLEKEMKLKAYAAVAIFHQNAYIFWFKKPFRSGSGVHMVCLIFVFRLKVLSWIRSSSRHWHNIDSSVINFRSSSKVIYVNSFVASKVS